MLVLIYKSFLLLKESMCRGYLLIFRTLCFLLFLFLLIEELPSAWKVHVEGMSSRLQNSRIPASFFVLWLWFSSSLSSALACKRVCSGCLVFCPRLILLLGLLFLDFFSFWGLTTSSIDKVGSSLLEDCCRGSIGRWSWWRCWRFSCRFRRLHNLEW